MRAFFAGILVLLVAAAAVGCSQSPAPPPAAAPSPEQPAPTEPKAEPVVEEVSMEEQGHVHTAPHGGTLVMLGDHVANVELVLNPAIGALTAYVLDGHAENPVRISAPSLNLAVSIEGREMQTLSLMPAENVLTGETRESTSQFTAQFDELKGVSHFTGSFPEITILGVTMRNIAFEFP